jgi:hypothetical protein
MTDRFAVSGYWRDMQDAIDSAVVGDTVIIPDGVFNYVDVNEWEELNIPEGVHLRSLTPPDLEMVTVEGRTFILPKTCHTVLKLPWDVVGYLNGPTNTWIHINGTGNPNLTTSFSGLHMQPYRTEHPASPSNPLGAKMCMYAMQINKVMNFRVHHSIFLDIGYGLSAGSLDGSQLGCGVFDHNKIINSPALAGQVGGAYGGNFNGYDFLTVGYGINPIMYDSTYWDADITHILGKFTPYSIFAEDNLLSRWRHCMCVDGPAHGVMRHNLIISYGSAEFDAHGSPQGINGSRCLEVYDNVCLNDAVNEGGWDNAGNYHTTMGAVPAGSPTGTPPIGQNFRGGAGISFNNFFGSKYGRFTDIWWENPGVHGGETHDLWFFNNVGNLSYSTDGSPVLDRDFWIGLLTKNPDGSYSLPRLANSGYAPPSFPTPTWNYLPYIYPHPLVGSIVTTPKLKINSNLQSVPFTLRKI